MKKHLLFSYFLVLSLLTFANDGAYFSGGGTIYPVKESNISMNKEILSFRVVDGMCHVTIHFEFLNPGKESKKLLVGFQAPQAVGDVTDDEINHSQIFDFMVSQNQTLLPYQLKTAACEDCELIDKQTIQSTQAGEYVFVYLFEVEFKPGITELDHSYRFRAGDAVMTDQIYSYILKTGAKWAGGKINDLTVNLDLGNTPYFYVSDIFGKEASWIVHGIGKVTRDVYNNYETDCKLIRNTFFAQLGYVFSDADLNTYFRQFDWYIPNPNLKSKDLKLPENVEAFIEEIQSREKR